MFRKHLRDNSSKMKSYIALALLLSMVFVSCSPTKYLQKNQYILKDNKLSLTVKSIDKAEVKNYVKQQPNRTLLGWPMYVAIYAMVNPEKEAKRDVKRAAKLKEKNKRKMEKGKKTKESPFYLSRWWRNSVGEAPVIFDTYSILESETQMKSYLRNLGYYDAEITDSVAFDEKAKRAIVHYNIEEGVPFKIAKFVRKIQDKRIDSLLLSKKKNFLLDTSALFDAYKLDNLRYDISDFLQNEGYYGFGPDQVVYYVDTILDTHQAQIKMELFNTSLEEDSVVDNQHFPVFYFDQISVSNYPYDLHNMNDINLSSRYFGNDSIRFNYYDELTFRPYLLQRRVDIKPDSIFRQDDVARSIRSINGLGIFKSVNFKITASKDIHADSTKKYLDCEIQLSPSTKQSYTIDLEAYTSSGTIGTGLKFSYLHKNLFKRAIYFNISLDGKIEKFSTDISTESSSLFAYEYGVNSTIKFPKFFSPFRLYKFNNRYFPNTLVNFNFTFKNRSEYVRQTNSLSFGYSWSTPSGIKHNLNPIDFYLTKFKDVQYDYLQYLLDKNLYDQYFDHVIPAGNYSIFYSNQKFNSRQNFFFINMRVELAGNLLSLGNHLLNQPKTGSGDLYIKVIEAFAHEYIADSLQQEFIEHTSDSMNIYGNQFYTFAGILYNQYLKSDIDLRYNWFLGKRVSLVTRFFGGLIFPYGNTGFSPIEKQYFVGGANDLRAWWARSIGPGAYVLDEQTLQLENYYQNGDIKLLANFELRHDILWLIKGAIFADVGNIWNIYSNPSFPGGNFKFDTFYNQFAVGVGYGLRFDLSFFILRFDLAFKLRDPSLPTNNKWVYSQEDNYYKQPILNFGIGYPF